MIATNEDGTAVGEHETKDAWRRFQPELWQRDVKVRWFLRHRQLGPGCKQ